MQNADDDGGGGGGGGNTKFTFFNHTCNCQPFFLINDLKLF